MTSQDTARAISELKSEISSLREELREFRNETKALIEIQKKLVGSLKIPVCDKPVQLSSQTPSLTQGQEPPATSKPVKRPGKITISDHGSKNIMVSGNTFDYNDIIKASGPAKFDSATKSWILPLASLSALETNLRACEKVTLFVSESLVSGKGPRVEEDPEEELAVVQPPAFSSYMFQD